MESDRPVLMDFSNSFKLSTRGFKKTTKKKPALQEEVKADDQNQDLEELFENVSVETAMEIPRNLTIT